MKENSITVPRWRDRHLHIREGEMLKLVLPCTLAQQAIGAVIMPNLANPVSTISRAREYRDEITATLIHHTQLNPDFTPCMTCYLTDDTDPKEVVEGFEEGVWKAVKLYMANQQGQGGTTGSAHGVKNLLGCYQVFEAMQKAQIPLLGHFEAVEEDVDEFDREIVSVERDLMPIMNAFPALPIVFEHLTDGRTADFVAEAHHNIQATVTAHHLMINRNAMFWGGMNPINYCKPVPKREEHRLKVRKYVTSGNRRFGAGTDSAPHDKSNKARCCGCSAGIFTALNAVELYTTVFDEDDALQHLGPFLSENFLALYGVEVSKQTMTIRRQTHRVPMKISGGAIGAPEVMIFRGGMELHWELVG